MTTEKIAVSVPRELLQKARRAVRRGSARSLSAYISGALEQKTMLDELDSLLESMLAETGGPLTPDEVRAADAAISGPPRTRRRR